LICRNSENSIGVLNDQIVADITGKSEFVHGFEATNSMVAMNNKITWSHLVGIDRATGGFASTSDIPRGSKSLLAKKLSICNQGDAPSG
jgi:hypothetical protein